MSSCQSTDADKFGENLTKFVEKGGIFVICYPTNIGTVVRKQIKDIGGTMEKYIPLKPKLMRNVDLMVHTVCDTEYKGLFQGVSGSLGKTFCTGSELNSLCSSVTVATSKNKFPLVLVSKAKKGLVVQLNFCSM
eukprot:UN31763